MSSGLRRGEIYRVRQPQRGYPKKSRCFAAASRQDLLDTKASRVLCRQINTSGVGLSTRLTHLEKCLHTEYIGALSLATLKQLYWQWALDMKMIRMMSRCEIWLPICSMKTGDVSI